MFNTEGFILEDGQLVLEKSKIYPASESDVLLQVKAFGVNRADLLLKKGLYPTSVKSKSCASDFGLEFSGVVQEIGENSTFKVGDRVCGLCSGGAFAQHIYSDERLLIRLPDSMSMIDAAAIPEAWSTALLHLCHLYTPKPGGAVLIHSAAGGVGLAGIQIAKHFDLEVTAVASSNEKLLVCEKLGADRMMNYKEQSYESFFKEFNDYFDLIFDTIGGPLLSAHVGGLKYGGKIASIGLLGGAQGELPMGKFLFKNASIQAATLKSQSVKVKGSILLELARFLNEGFGTRTLQPSLSSCWNIHDLESAFEEIKKNRNVGNVVVSWE